MKAAIAGTCVGLAVIGFEIATGIDFTFGARMLIVIPLCVLAGMLVGGNR